MFEAIQKEFEALIDHYQYDQAEKLLLKNMHDLPDEHIFVTVLSNVYYDQQKYEQALAMAEKAYGMAPDDALVLWDYAGALFVTGHTDKAIKMWKTILDMGFELLAYGPYGEGKRWAKSLISDTHYRLSLAYASVLDFAVALTYINKAIDARGAGLRCIYSIKDVRKSRKQILEAQEK